MSIQIYSKEQANNKNEIIRTKTTKIVQIYHYKNSDIKRANIKQKPTKLNLKPCCILSKTANHLSILNLLIEIFQNTSA